MPRRLPRILVSLALAGMVAAASSAAWATSLRAAPAAATTVTVYLAPASKGGSDQHTGGNT